MVRSKGLGNYLQMKAHLLVLKGIGCLSITEEDNFSFYTLIMYEKFEYSHPYKTFFLLLDTILLHTSHVYTNV